jgi:glyceraldehyde-3-phosphate dehydrogenase (NADP+)
LIVEVPMRVCKLFLGGRWEDGAAAPLAVDSPFDGSTVSSVARASAGQISAAADTAASAVKVMADLSPEKRAKILEGAREHLLTHREEIAALIVEEAGKPVSLARVEVDRAADTFLAAAHVARYPVIEARDLGGFASGTGRLALVRRVPVGPVLAISPFNFPLNLVVHKLAPAVAAGCPVVLKPASQTPSAALAAAEALEAGGLPAGGLSVLPSRAADFEALVTDRRFRLLTFTGSAEVGWALKKKAWDKKVTLELGGNAGVIVEPDAGDLADVSTRIAVAASAFAGQSCISVQRIYVHEFLYAEMRRLLADAFRAVPTGDPSHPRTLCGPMIDGPNADRVMDWIGKAKAAGGKILAGGSRAGAVVEPTLLEGVPKDQPVVADEIFGPAAVLACYSDFGEALAEVDDSRFGLQAGVFTKDVTKIRRAWERLEVGGLIQGDVPTWRSDPMPYGGAKESGTGREGPAFTWREMTEERLLVLK